MTTAVVDRLRPGTCGRLQVHNAPGQTVACKIDKATSPSYTTDLLLTVGSIVHLVVSYTDAFPSGQYCQTHDGYTATLSATPTRAVQAAPAENAAPKFGIQDREIDGDDAAPESVTRMVKEYDKAVGDFKAADSDECDGQ